MRFRRMGGQRKIVDRKTDKLLLKQMDKQTDKRIDKLTDKQMNEDVLRRTDIQRTDIQITRQTDTKTTLKPPESASFSPRKVSGKRAPPVALCSNQLHLQFSNLHQTDTISHLESSNKSTNIDPKFAPNPPLRPRVRVRIVTITVC